MKRAIVVRLASVAIPTFLGCGVDSDIRSGPAALPLQTVADCPDGYNVIEGSDLDDNLRGTNDNDCILGYGGNDVIRGRRGDDYLVGGLGGDTIYGNDGDDLIFGEDGADFIRGNRGNDFIDGGNGADVLQGDDGSDTISGGDGPDIITGGQGHDTLAGGEGNDEISGQRGNDSLDGGDGDDVLSGGDGSDVIRGGAGDDTILDPDQRDIVIDNVGDGAVTVSFNTWPVVESIIPSPASLDVGETTALTVDVSDPDGDPLSYSWTTNCTGFFSNPEMPEPTFTLTILDGDLCTLVLHVSDARGGQTTGSITISTGALE